MFKWFADIFEMHWLSDLMRFVVQNIFGLSMKTTLRDSIHFFLYDSVKIIILLALMIFLISYVRSYFPPEKTKKILEKFSGVKGNIMSSLLGIVTPFCSCSSVPIFIGFVESGIPLGVTFSFLITSPIVNEAAFVVLLAIFGWKVAFLYVATGVIIGVVGGILIGALHLEKEIEEYVYEMAMGEAEIEELDRKQRLIFAWDNVKELLARVWKYILIGIGIGALIHGWAPASVLAKYAGPQNPFAVLIGVLIGIPLYADTLGTIPIAETLIAKGVGIGTALSFMMATTALSFPEIVLLKKVIKPKLITAFVSITAAGIILVGYLFNLLIDYII